MSYFSSLSQYNDTKNAVAQHTQDAEQAVKDAKADASQKAFEGYSQLLESAGGSTTGLAGGFHVTRKIYKKYKALKQAGKDAKDALEKVKGGDNTGTQEGGEEGGEEGDQEGGEEPSTEEPETQSSAPEPSTEVPEPSTEAPEVPTQSIPEPEPNGLEAEPSSVEQDTELSPEDNDYLQDILKRYPEDVQRGGDMVTQEQSQSSSTEVANPEDTEVANPEANTQLSSFSNEGQGADSGAVRPTNTAPEPLAETNEEPSTRTGEPEPEPDVAGAEDTAESADRIEQGAQAFSKITPTPKGNLGGLGVDGGADASDLADAGSSLLSTGLETAGTVLDFLGPVGEVVGAGVALGGFFHSLFDGDEKSKESADENQVTNIAQGGGISAESLKTASQSTNLVGTTY